MSSSIFPPPLASALNLGVPLNQRQPAMSFTVLDPYDGSTIRVAPDRTEARAQNGDVLTYYPATLDYSFATQNGAVATLADGTAVAAEHGNLVIIQHDGTITAQTPNQPAKTLGVIGQPGFDLQAALVGTSLLDPELFEALSSVYNHHNDMSYIPQIRRDFSRSTDALFEDIQSREIRQRFDPNFKLQE